MSALAPSPNGYNDATRSIGTAREVEYRLLARVNGRMNRAMGENGSFPALVEAVNENLDIWQAFALDVIQNENGLPNQLRAQIVYLYEFTRAHTNKVIGREADATVLIDINTTVMGGLRPAQPVKGSDQCQA